MWRNLSKFLRLTPTERQLFLEAFFALARARLLLATRPFNQVAERLGQAGEESPPDISPRHEELAGQIGHAVETVARRTPWESRCLAQALAAWRMLHRRDIAGTIYFGVAPNPDKPFDAHAWLRCGTRIVTGGKGHENFRVISCFAQIGKK